MPAFSSVVSSLRVNKEIPTCEGWVRSRGIGKGKVSSLKEQKLKKLYREEFEDIGRFADDNLPLMIEPADFQRVQWKELKARKEKSKSFCFMEIRVCQMSSDLCI